ncbi:MAG: PH domain-containing protein [Gammaproteobacteria bacterium]|nr:MAG: PH domain-containing protein [Gammaproteobacteria bacterium]
MHVFKSKIDNWVLICLLLSISACLLGASVALSVGGTANYVFAAIILILGAGFPVWLYASTRYIVTGDDLKIVSGPFSWNIPIQSIVSVQETQNASASPALSFDRLEIIYGEGKAIIVSPLDKAKFIQKLGKERFIFNRRNARSKAAAKDFRNKAKRNKTNRSNT